jgi:Ca2+-binding RTX toxin-like protein
MTDGTSGADNMVGTTGADTLNGLGGDDRINALSRVAAGGGAFDIIDGGADTDTFVINASGETQTVNLFDSGSPSWYVTSTSGNYRVDAYNVEKVEFTGGSGDDYINTANGGVIVNGGGGNDHWLADLSAVSSNITFELGSTSSIGAAGLTFISSVEKLSLTTGSGADSLTGGSFGDYIVSGLGDDVLDARTRSSDTGGGFDILDGGDGVDTFVVNASSETQTVNLFDSGSPSWYVTSTTNNFRIDAYNVEKVKFTGGSGDDYINSASGGVSLNGGAGNDHWQADLSALTSNVGFDLIATHSIAAAGLADLRNMEKLTLTTGSGKDTVTGGAFADYINTGAGNDILNAKSRGGETGGAFDVLDGGDGIDVFVVDATFESQSVSLVDSGSPSWYVTSVSGNFRVDAYNVERVKFTGGSGDDIINTGSAGLTVSGVNGIDLWIADYSASNARIVYDVATTHEIAAVGLQSIGGISKISLTTGSGKDKVTGYEWADTIITGDGNDQINARARFAETGGAFDFVDGGDGVDQLTVDATLELTGVFLTVAGSPSFYVTSVSNHIRVDAFNVERVRLFGGLGADTAMGAGQSDAFDGGGGNDTLNGAGGADALDGGDGNDSLIGGLGADSLAGSAGVDVLSGGDQTDRLTGGAGQDTLTGGAASDVFVFRLLSDSGKNAPDLIADLANSDVIDLSLIDANTGVGGDQAFVVVGAFTGAAGQAVLAFAGGVTTLSLDVDGDSKADSVIAMTGDHHSHGNFVL